MPFLHLPDKWRRQPSGPVAVNWGNPITRGLVLCHAPWVFDRNLAAGNFPTLTGTASTIQGGAGGVGRQWTATTPNTYVAGSDSLSASSGAITYLSVIRRDAAEAISLIGLDGGVTSTNYAFRLTSTGALSYLLPRTAEIATDSTLGLALGETSTVALSLSLIGGSGTNRYAFYKNGASGVYGTTIQFQSYVTGYSIGGTSDGASGMGRKAIYLTLAWNRELSVPESVEITKNPFQVLRRQPRTLYFTAGGGGATYDESVSEALATTSAQGPAVDWLGTASETVAATTAQGNTLIADVTATMTLAVTTTEAGALDTAQTVAEALAVVTAQAQDGAITMSVAEAVGIMSTQASTADLQAAVSEALAAVSAQAGTASLAVAIGEAIAVVVDQWVAGATVDAAVSETLAATTTLAVTVDVAGVISETLAAVDARSVISTETGAVTMAIGIADAVLSGLVSTLGVTEAVAITTAEGGSIITAEFRTPDGRTVRIKLDARTLSVIEDDRTLYVSQTMH